MIASLAAPWQTAERSALGWRDHLLTMVFGTWLLVGLFVDGWAHTNLETLETFFTPWHALFYSGFGATAAWVAYCVQRVGGVPRGYESAIIGIAVFGVGGMGDLIWHTLFGIERDVEALLSPTHLVLFVGLVLILASPFQAAWSAPADAPSLRAFLPPLLSLTMLVALCLFFLMYLTPFNTFDALSQRDAYIAHLPEARIAADYRDLSVRAGLAGFYISTAALLAPLLLVLRRWRPHFGTATLLFSATTLLVSALQEFRLAPLVVAAAAAGLMADGLIRWLRPSPARVGAYGLFAALVPVVLWGAYFTTVALVWGTWWTVNLVGGAIGISSLIGLGLAVLTAADRREDHTGRCLEVTADPERGRRADQHYPPQHSSRSTDRARLRQIDRILGQWSAQEIGRLTGAEERGVALLKEMRQALHAQVVDAGPGSRTRERVDGPVQAA
jgi:hypothetical protein